MSEVGLVLKQLFRVQGLRLWVEFGIQALEFSDKSANSRIQVSEDLVLQLYACSGLQRVLLVATVMRALGVQLRTFWG